MFFLVFRYKRLSNTGCKNNWYGSFTEIQEAKIACKEDDNCSAVYDVECGNGNKYHLCPEEDGEGEDVWINSAMSCIHLKLIVGRYIETEQNNQLSVYLNFSLIIGS